MYKRQALWCGIANGAEKILLPEEKDYDEQALIEDILENKKRGKKNYIIINAEGIGDSINMAKRIEEATGIETRATILGHMQRGGSPTCKDRVYASTMGALAVDLLCEGKSNRVIAVSYTHLLKRIQSYDGVLPFNDKADPDTIKAEFGMSKAAFKRAVGKMCIRDRREYVRRISKKLR